MSLIRQIIRNIVLACVLIMIGIEAGNFHLRFLRQYVGSAVVMVKHHSGGGGTGFGVKTKSGAEVILTNKHVCEAPGYKLEYKAAEFVFIKSETGYFESKVIAVDTEHDLCIVKMVPNVSTLHTGFFQPAVGDTIAIIGHPMLTPLQVSKGIYNGYTKKYDLSGLSDSLDLPIELPIGWTSAPSYPGNSGSPVVNFYGQVVGVLFAGMAPTINMIVPIDAINKFLSRY